MTPELRFGGLLVCSDPSVYSTMSSIAFVLSVVFIAAVCVLHAENRVLAEVRFITHNRCEKTAGVWVDGQYLGYAKELRGDEKLLLLPGKHELLVRQPVQGLCRTNRARARRGAHYKSLPREGCAFTVQECDWSCDIACYQQSMCSRYGAWALPNGNSYRSPIWLAISLNFTAWRKSSQIGSATVV